MTDVTNDQAAAEDRLAFAAWGFAQRGWRVLPVHWIKPNGHCSCINEHWMPPCSNAGKHPLYTDWPTAATTEAQTIANWWGRDNPEANIGIATGAESGIWVLDVDEGRRKDGSYKEGLESLLRLAQDHDDLPETYSTRTGGRGTQYFFRYPAGMEIKSTTRALGERFPDIDARGEGGQVVAPPSRSGKGPYTVDTDSPLADTPDWLVQLLLEAGTATLGTPVRREVARPLPDTPPPPVVMAETTPAPGWFAASVAAKLQAVIDAPEGQGNDTINRMSFMIGQYVPNGWITREEAEERLNAAVATWAHPDPTAASTIRHSLNDGMRQPYQRMSVAAAAGNMTDAVMADRVCGELLAGRYCWADGMDWLSWDGHVWSMSTDVEVTETVRQYVMAEVQAALPAVADNGVARRALMDLLSRAKIKNMVQLARGIVQVRADRFDGHRDLLNTPSGVVDLRDGTWRSHDPGLYFMKITAVEYVPDATHPDWDAALSAVPEDCHEWFRMRMGQALTGYMTPDDTLLVLQGGGENGKSTVLIALGAALGTSTDGGYHVAVPSAAMTGKTDDPHALMPFKGTRFAVAEELPEGRRLNATRLKETVGTPVMTGRYMYKSITSWKSTHSLFLTTNYIPSVAETDHGTWRRLLMLKFPYRFVKPGRPLENENDRRGDPQLRQRVMDGKEQQEAALAWAVRGAVEWYRADRSMGEPPARVEADTHSWRRDSDLILAYWDHRLEADPQSWIMGQDLLDDFKAWLAATGHPHGWTDKLIGMRFESHDETISHRIARAQFHPNDHMSRPPGYDGAPWPVGQKRCWIGVRFKR
jgi:putative DNA primase/helicase